MTYQDIEVHEATHALAAALASVFMAKRLKAPINGALQDAKLYLEVHPSDPEGAASLGLVMDTGVIKDFANGTCALAPAFDGESIVRECIAKKSLGPVINSAELSEPDREAYRQNPVHLKDTLIIGLATRMYLDQLGTRQAKYAQLIHTAARRQGGFVDLQHVVNIDKALNVVKQSEKRVARLYQEADPAAMAAEADRHAKARWEAKQANYANASPRERHIRDRINASARHAR